MSRRKYTNEEIIASFVAKAQELGRVPTTAELKSDPNMPAIHNFTDIGIRRLAQYTGLKKKVNTQGLRPFTQKYSREMLAEQMKKKIAALGRRPSNREINADPNIASAPTFKKYFGSLEAAFREAEE